MHHENKPENHELPSSATLIKSTVLAIATAVLILVTIVLPAEYDIDPTGIGTALGLAEMGEIKQQLSEEALQDHEPQSSNMAKARTLASLLSGIFITTAHANDLWTDEISVTLARGEGVEIKLVMEKGAVAEYSWSTDTGVVNYDLHGDGKGVDGKRNSISYEKGRGLPSDEGSLTAAFTGNHGWFWRNRGKKPVTVTLRVRGDYSEMKRLK